MNRIGGDKIPDKIPPLSNQGAGTTSKQEKISKHDEQSTAEVAQKSLMPNGEISSNEIPIGREQIKSSEVTKPEVDKMISSATDEEPKTIKPAMNTTIKNAASKELLNNSELSPGRRELLKEIDKYSEQFEPDIIRLKISFGSSPPIDPPGDSEMKREAFSKELLTYIKDKNPNLSINREKVDEILFSLTQSLAGKLEQSRLDVLPDNPWGSTSNTHKENIKFEENVLVTTITSKKTYTYMVDIDDPDDPDAKKIEVTYETRIIHNLADQNDVKFRNKLTIDGKTEEWDPLVKFTTEKHKELFVQDSTTRAFQAKLTPNNYVTLKNEVNLINNFISKNLAQLLESAQNSEKGSISIVRIPNLKQRLEMIQAITVTQNGEVFVHVPVTEYARGGEKTTIFAVQLYSNGRSLMRKNEESIFAHTVFPEFKGSQIGIVLDRLDEEQLLSQNGERKVMNKIQNFKYIVEPFALRSFKMTGGINSNNLNAMTLENIGKDSLKNKVLNLKKAADFDRYRRYATGILSGVNQFHQAGIYHRQIKPENIILHSALPKLTNFNLVASKEDRVLPARSNINDPYNAPEIRAGKETAQGLESADLYSVGVCLFSLSHGTVSPNGNEIAAFINANENKVPESENDRIILRLLNDDPAKRGTAKEALEAIQKLKYEAPQQS
jgi:serine/threonine protein kinase